MINPNTLEPTQEVRYAPESAGANAIRVMELVREKKAKIKHLRSLIKSGIENDSMYAELCKELKDIKRRVETRKYDVIKTHLASTQEKLDVAKSDLEGEQLALSGWVGEHVKETGQLSLFDSPNNKVHHIKVAYKIK